MLRDYKKILDIARNLESHSYSPYSQFKVCAVVEVDDGKYIYGVNVENASYGLSMCAERVALFSLYSQGYSKDNIVKMAVLGSGKNPVSPCGACRQVMSELMNEDIKIILGTISGNEVKIIENKELLPNSFKKEDLNE